MTSPEATPMFLLWICFAAAPPVSGPVIDGLGMFSSEAKAAAVVRLAKLRERYGYELWIETVERQPPMGDVAGLLFKRVREEKLRMWVRDQALESGMERGLYIIVSRDPPDVRMVGYPTNVEDRLTWSRREEVRGGMRQYLRRGEYDRALGEAVDRFAGVLEVTQEPSSPLAALPLVGVMAALSGVWVVLCVVRRRVLGRNEPMYPAAVQGALFGPPSSSGIYDRLEKRR